MKPAESAITSETTGRGPRIFYVAGPGDAIGVFRNWLQGRDDPDQVAVAYTTQFFDVCRDLDATAHVVCFNRTPDVLEAGSIRVEHRPPPSLKGNLLYHIGQLGMMLAMVASALKFRADVVVCGSSSHCFVLSILAARGVKVVPTLHCVLWPQRMAQTGAKRWLLRLNGRFFQKHAAAILSLSDDVTRQVLELSPRPRGPIIAFLPSYRPSRFAKNTPPPSSPPFRVLYVGRVERVKGVFDLLEIARRFARDGRTDVEFDLCGTGSVLDDLRRDVLADASLLGGRFRLHGHCKGEVMTTMFNQSHVVIAPTTTEFVEGFNKVVAEGVLAGRPVITSSVCPALEYVREAVEVVPPDDVPAYASAILRLADDHALYQSKRDAGVSVAGQFYDPHRGWGAALKTALQPMIAGRQAEPLVTVDQGAQAALGFEQP